MSGWRDIWTIELADIFKECGLSMKQCLMLTGKIMNSKMIEELCNNGEQVLEKLNRDNYEMLSLGLKQRVSDNERFLFKIEDKLVGGSKIQKRVYKEYKESLQLNGGK